MTAKPAAETFVIELLGQMSLAQKVGQMTMAERMHATPEDAQRFGLGSVLAGGGSSPGENTPADWVAMNDAYWQAMVADTDGVGIPIIFGIDAVHGHNNVRGATIFPHNIALGAADSVALVEQIARSAAIEILASGVEWNFAPTLAVVQNCQWGRTYESFGSNSARVAALGEAYVRALQGEGVMACAKHWVGDGATLHGIDQGETRLAWEELEKTHIAPYYPSLRAGVMSVMASFSSWNGDKCHGHHFLINELLKDRLGFDGIVVSDWDGIDYLDEDYATAIAKSVNAGLDMFMVSEQWPQFIDTLQQLVTSGAVPEQRIDDAVLRILRTKARLGLFDAPRPAQRPHSYSDDFGCAAHRAIARKAVRRSQVLLKNSGVLPLQSDQRVLVAGRNANDIGHQCGGWTLSWQGDSGNESIVGTSIWQGIAERFPHAVLSADLTGSEADLAQHDLAVVVIGETPYAEGLGDIRSGDDLLVACGSMVDGLMKPLEPYGNTLSLSELHPEDLACIARIAAAGVPVVTVLVAGRPLIVNEELAASQAFVVAWLPGSEGGGVADMLSGGSEYSGRLPLPWPSHPIPESPSSECAELFAAGFGIKTNGDLLGR